MGQKTHPLGFRLGIIKQHKSNWFTKLNKYSILLNQDYKIRSCFNNLLKLASITNISIIRNKFNSEILLNIETARPSFLFGIKNLNFSILLKKIQKITSKNTKIIFNIIEIKDVDINASLLNDYIVELLEKRTPFRRAVKKALERAKFAKVKGIKIQVSGRLNGAEMARTEWIRHGRVPLQTISANIDYSSKEAKTIYGLLGIKIWLFKD
jgi:small subunit ribosomal protein S3